MTADETAMHSPCRALRSSAMSMEYDCILDAATMVERGSCFDFQVYSMRIGIPATCQLTEQTANPL